MKSIDKLRKWCDFLVGSSCDGCSKTLHLIADEIETEVEQMESLMRDMARELRDLNDDGIPTDCMEHEGRMRELRIEVD